MERKRRTAVRRGADVGVGTERDVDHAGVDQGQELLGPQRWGPGFEPVDPTSNIGLEVDVGPEREASELDDRPQVVAQDPEHLLGRLDRAAPLGQRLVQIGLDHLVDLRLVVPTGRVVAIGAGEDVAGRVEVAVLGLELGHHLFVVTVDPGRRAAGSRAAADRSMPPARKAAWV